MNSIFIFCLGYMWLHIRGVGEWTNRLYNYFEKEQEKLHNIDQELPGTPRTPVATNGTPTENKGGIKRLQAYVPLTWY